MNITGAIGFILHTVFSLYIGVILLRVIFQYVRAPFSNPICQFIITVTNHGFKIFRKFIPGFKGIDFAGIVFGLVVAMVYRTLASLLIFSSLPSILGLTLGSVFTLISTFLSIYFWGIILRVIFSFISAGQFSYNPIYDLVYLVSEPVLRPIRNKLPPVSGFDLSPLVAIMGIAVLRILFSI